MNGLDATRRCALVQLADESAWGSAALQPAFRDAKRGLKHCATSDHDRHLLAAAAHFGLRGIDIIKFP